MGNDSTKDSIKVCPAAIWARVSTHDQAETSLPTQISRCRIKLEEGGYSLTHTLSVDWSSLDLFSCPEFQQLLNLIRNRKVEAVAILDRDRLEARGLQRLIFMSECKEAGVKLEICQGPPILDEPEGQLIELALAIGKERSVIRARQGSRDGLHDRAVKYHKPVTYHKLYGYQWDKANNKLVPDDNWENLKLIFDMLLDGKGYHPITEELIRRGILSPSGQPSWNKTAFSNIAHNPAYAGRYYALKKTAIEPAKRRGKTYGNSSTKKVPLERAHYISEIEIVDPPITWEQRQRILDQLAHHQKLAQRNAKREYLLRGFILCGTHTGKNGEPRRYHGQPNPHHRNRWRYTCPVGGCPHPSVDGSSLEEEVKEHVWQLLDENLDNVAKLMDMRIETEESVKGEISSIQQEYQRKISALSQLEIKELEGRILPVVYDRTKTNLENRIGWLLNRQDELTHQLEQLSHQQDAYERLAELSSRYVAVWERGELSFDDWRELLSLLNLEIYVYPTDVVLDINKNGDHVYKVPGHEVTKCEHGFLVSKRVDDAEELVTGFPYCEIRFGVDIAVPKNMQLTDDLAQKAVDIVLGNPGRDL